MPKLQVSLRLSVAAFALSISSIGIASPALAQSSITLPSASLEDSLNALSRQSGTQILVDQTLLRGKKAPSVRGASSVEAALAQLLRGSGLTWQKRGSAFLIVRQGGVSRPAANAAPEKRPTPTTTEIATAEATGESEAIVVTGSRIARPELESAMPVSVTRMDDFIALGRTNAYDALSLDPALGIGLSLSSDSTGWDGGISAVNLRNLGTNRSLTLIDGQRRVSSSARSSAVDIGVIPVGMIDRFEVVTGGAAAIYGADAVTGAVNIITKKTVEGLNITATNGLSQRGDSRETMVSFSTGGKFAGDRGSFAIGGTWSNTAPLKYVDRYGSKFHLYDANNPANTGIGDGIPDKIRIRNVSQIYYDYNPTYFLNNKEWIVENGVPREASYDTYFTRGEFSLGDGGDGRTLNDADQFRGKMDSISLLGRADYDVTDNIQYNAYFSYARQKYVGAEGGNSIWRDDSRSVFFDGFGGSVAYLDNPYLPPAVRQVMLDNNLTRLNISRTYGNFPQRSYDHDRESYTVGQSLGGNLSDKLNWHAFWQYGRTKDNVVEGPVPWKEHWLAARDVIADPVTGNPVCRDATARANGCVPLDIFSLEPPSKELLNYVMASRHETRTNSQQIFGGGIDGRLFSLPYGDVSIAIGAEHRTEKLRTKDDALALSGQLVYCCALSAHPELDVKFDVSEVYGEIVVPILKDLAFAQRLEIEGAYRYSDYSTVGGTDTWKGGATWSPFDWITFRGVRSRSVRTPNFGELYEPQVTSATGSIDDPCETNAINANPNRQKNCAALGIPAAGLPDIKTGPLVTTGGNPDLQPETSNSLTLGVVLQPRFLPGFDLTVDYWDIDIKNVITQFSYVQLLRLCVDLPSIDNDYCSRIVRDSATNGPTSIQSNQLNASRLYSRGIDVGVNYRLPVGPGQLRLSFKGSYLLKLVTETTPGIATGDVIADGGYRNPRFKASLLTAYDIGKFNIAINTRFLSASTYDLAFKDQPEAYPDNTVPPMIYNDLSMQYRVNDNYQIGAGVKNITDTKPPYLPETVVAADVYDLVGRYFYVTAGLKF